MAHELYRLKEKLCNTPHLMDAASFESVMEYLNSRNVENIKLDSGLSKGNDEENSRYCYNKDIGVAVLNIDGPLSYKPVTIMGFDCGGASYQQLKEDFTYLVEDGAKTIAFSVSSGGGEAYQMMPTASYMRQLATERGVNLLAFVDGLSASAAYGLSVIADEIIMAPGSEVGSVGVLVRLMNDSKALEKEGYERTFISAGDEKIPFSADGSFRKEFLEDIQSKVDILYSEFTGFVAEHRNLSVEAVRSTQAKTFLPERALELGLADKVMTLEGFYSYLADVAQGGNLMLKNKLFNNTNTEVQMKELEELQVQHSELEAKFNSQGTELAALVEQVASLSTETAQAKEALQAAVAEKESLQAKAEESKALARKDVIAKVESDAEKQASLFEATASLSDVAFDTVMSSMKAKDVLLEDSDLFTRKSSNSDLDQDQMDGTAAILKAKYQTK